MISAVICLSSKMAANLIIGGILETLYKRLSGQNVAGDKRIGGRSVNYTKNLFK